MTPEDAEEYTQALALVGAGWWRQVAWGARQGVHEALGLTLEEWRTNNLGGLVLMSIPERRSAVSELADEGFHDHEIAAIVGASERTIQYDLQRNSAPEDQSQAPEADDLQRNSAPEDQPSLPGDDQKATPETTAKPPRTEVNDGDEWYTPQWLFDALGIKFAIDVCAPLDLSHTSVPAERHFTIQADGLAQPWQGTVWCNPPYSKPEPWARRMIHHRDGLLLTHMPMNAGWCVDTWEVCDAIRLFQAMEFVRPDGSLQRPGYWLQLAAFGPVATEALARLQPLGDAAANKRRIASPMWRRAA